MKKCGEDCIPCCDYCKYVVHNELEFENNKVLGCPIFCKLHLDEEHRQLARRCSYCEDFWCMNVEEEFQQKDSYPLNYSDASQEDFEQYFQKRT